VITAVETSTGGRKLPAELCEVLESVGLDPALARLTRRGSSSSRSAFLALPSPSSPRLLVPLGRAGGQVVRERGRQGAHRKAAGRLFAAALSTGAMSLLPTRRVELADPALAELTDRLVGGDVPGVRLGILLGPPRANRKAVVRVLTEDGTTLSYAKVGATDLTRRLVRDEARHLERLAAEPPESFRVPEVLRFRDDDDLTILVTSPLASGRSTRRPVEIPVSQTRELFCRHQEQGVAVGDLAVVRPAVVAELTEARRLESMRERLVAAIGSLRLGVGDSHGDWAPQNMALGSEGLEVWDWERYDTGVPQGFDALHFLARRVDPSPGRLADTEADFLREAPATLHKCGIDPGLTQPLVALYLLWVGRRYAADGALRASAETQTRLRWVTGLLQTQLSDLETKGRRG
jgi:hypothetical protein